MCKGQFAFSSFGKVFMRSSGVLIEPFTNQIPTQIVRCGHRLIDVIHGVQMGDYIIFKTSALVTVNTGQNPIHIEPFID